MNCKIVQDLLPNYIESLTAKETDKYIEEHLSNCKECSKVYDMLKSEIKNENSINVEIETKYLKKFNKKLKFFRIVLLGIILIFTFIMGRRMIILQDIQTKVSKYENIDTYYLKRYYYVDDSIDIYESYVKEEKYKIIEHFISENINDTLIRYGNGTLENRYFISNGSKLAQLNQANIGIAEFKPKMYNNLWEFIVLSFTTTITSENCNGMDCYKLNLLFNVEDNSIEKYKCTDYIEKSTGLLVRYIDNENVNVNNLSESGQINDYKYIFKNIDDDVFTEPDITEYKVQEK